MSTDTYGVRIHQIEHTRIQLRIFNVYGDWVGIPASKNFFGRIIADSGPRYEKSRLSEILGEDLYEEKSFYFKASFFITDFKVLETKNYPGILENTFYYERNGRWQDEEKLPQILFEVEVSEPELLAHFREGDSWGTASYATESYRVLDENKEEWLAFVDNFYKTNEGKAFLKNPDQVIIERLVTGLQHNESHVANMCAVILGRTGKHGLSAVPTLMESVNDRDLVVFCAAARALGLIGNENAIHVLLPQIGSRKKLLRESCAWAIGRIAPQNTLCVDALQRIVNGEKIDYTYQEDEIVELSADDTLKTLSNFALYRITGETTYLKATLESLYLDDSASYAVYEVLEGLPQNAIQEAIPYIKTFLDSDHSNVEGVGFDLQDLLEL